jgi:hypothetical protein
MRNRAAAAMPGLHDRHGSRAGDAPDRCPRKLAGITGDAAFKITGPGMPSHRTFA